MDCPHCYGKGTVDDDYLTDELVEEVFSEYFKEFGWHTAYGVEKWEDYGDKVWIRQDTSARSCYNYEDHMLPREIFIRDNEKRAQLIKNIHTEHKKKLKADKRKQDLAKLERAKKQVEELTKNLT